MVTEDAVTFPVVFERAGEQIFSSVMSVNLFGRLHFEAPVFLAAATENDRDFLTREWSTSFTPVDDSFVPDFEKKATHWPGSGHLVSAIATALAVFAIYSYRQAGDVWIGVGLRYRFKEIALHHRLEFAATGTHFYHFLQNKQRGMGTVTDLMKNLVLQ